MLLSDYLKLFYKKYRVICGMFYYRSFINPKNEKNIITAFHKLYYNSAVLNRTWMNTFWFGVKTYKCPLDCWIYQEILFEQKPDVIIECGTLFGGSALFLAHLCDILNKGKVITIDIKINKNLPKHKRIKYLVGSSTSEEIVKLLKKIIKPSDKVLVILDSNHNFEHVIRELKIYSAFVSKGGYIIVEDTCANGHPVLKESGPGPMEAVKEFLKGNKEFKIDKSKEKFLMTFNPNGYLKRVK